MLGRKETDLPLFHHLLGQKKKSRHGGENSGFRETNLDFQTLWKHWFCSRTHQVGFFGLIDLLISWQLCMRLTFDNITEIMIILLKYYWNPILFRCRFNFGNFGTSIFTEIKSLPKFQLRVDECSCLFAVVWIPLTLPKFSLSKAEPAYFLFTDNCTKIKVDYSMFMAVLPLPLIVTLAIFDFLASWYRKGREKSCVKTA